MKFLKIALIFLVLLGLGSWLASYLFHKSILPKWAASDTSIKNFTAKRLIEQPIIQTDLHPRLQTEAAEYGYTNINAPTLMLAPTWFKNPLGTYYLYFAHHKGKYIRLAYADSLAGPWRLYDGEILPVAEAGLATTEGPSVGISTLKKYASWSEVVALSKIGADAKAAYEERTKQKMTSSPPTTLHIASPDVLVDKKHQEIRLYYHGVAEGNLQLSKVAVSKDGIHFTPKEGYIGNPYMRIFQHQGMYYGLAMPGFLYRSKDGFSDFKVRQRWLFDTHVRHSAVRKEGNDLYIFYSRVKDAPERILYSKVDMSSPNWNDWRATKPKELLRPALAWEGSTEPILPSMRGEMGVTVHQLRDPYVFEDANQQLYLLYTGGGEQGIGIAVLNGKW